MTSTLAVAFPASPAQGAVGDLGSAPKIDDDDIGTAPNRRARDGLGRLCSVRRKAGRFHGAHELLNVAAAPRDDEHVDVGVHGQRTRPGISDQRHGPRRFLYARSSRSRTCGSPDPAFAMPRLKM